MNREFLLAVIIGVTLFLSDFAIGWLTSITGRFPVIFIIALIIGIVAGKHVDGLLATALTWLVSIPLGMAITPLVYSELISPDVSLFGLFLFVPLWELRGTFNYQFEGNFIEEVIVGFAYLLIIIFIGPAIYVASLVFGLLGGSIGKLIRDILNRNHKSEDAAPDFQDAVIPK